ncbi:hypothetical protein SAMN05421877_107260 [Sphingobacterium lactis]|uniref:Uncharacterized protein n=1 Tax=Sphingobacterium lactis TaxID=797291 RepID=A0A1H6A0A3_9SPHI|nr:hypothetical protein SAMN05421877_107260 [Sphingobacterium lactis]
MKKGLLAETLTKKLNNETNMFNKDFIVLWIFYASNPAPPDGIFRLSS